MSLRDKITDKVDEFSGKAKEAAGTATGDEDLRAEGKADQVEAAVKGAVHEVRDAVSGAVDKAKDALGK